MGSINQLLFMITYEIGADIQQVFVLLVVAASQMII
jgi:hypothetical protein